ncbi:YdcF family protein [Candidatus Kaiserbacteria bacterium]|nr:YdcF family protein [Candidatus Kaiserbacteria bacterium]
MEQPLAIVIIGAYPHLKDGVWRTSGVDDPGDHAGATFDRFRILAGATLARRHPDALLILSGGAQPGADSCAEVARRELVELGVSGDRMILEERSRSVHQQLYEIGKLAQERHLGRLLVTTNEWHHPRLEAMIDHAPKLEMWRELEWERVDAEQVMLESRNPEWAAMVAAERTHPMLAKRTQMEEQGVRQVIDGTYRYLPF